MKRNAGPESKNWPRSRLRNSSKPSSSVLGRRWRPRQPLQPRLKRQRKINVTRSKARSPKKTRKKSNWNSIKQNLKMWSPETNS